MASETTVPPGYSDVIPPLHGARPAARLSVDPVICTQCLKWTLKMAHLVRGRMPIEFIIQTRRLGEKGPLGEGIIVNNHIRSTHTNGACPGKRTQGHASQGRPVQYVCTFSLVGLQWKHLLSLKLRLQG